MFLSKSNFSSSSTSLFNFFDFQEKIFNVFKFSLEKKNVKLIWKKQSFSPWIKIEFQSINQSFWQPGKKSKMPFSIWWSTNPKIPKNCFSVFFGVFVSPEINPIPGIIIVVNFRDMMKNNNRKTKQKKNLKDDHFLLLLLQKI